MVIVLFYILISAYALTICALIYGFKRLNTPVFKNTKTYTTFSVIIPFKDESENLNELLNALSQLNYPNQLFEVILVNDSSSDNSVAIIEAFRIKSALNIKLLHSTSKSNSPKKEALTKAILQAKHKWILTTDADCTFGSNLLNVYNNFIQHTSYHLIAGPVTYRDSNSFIKHFQCLDFSSLIGVTIGSFGLKLPFMCNGANLAYKKNHFLKLNGFKGNENIASGDDIFLLEKAIAYNKKQVGYLKHEDAVVFTLPQNSLKKLISQRLRWASKTSKSSLKRTKLLGLLVFIANSFCLLALINCVLLFIPIKITFILLSIKLIVDAILIHVTLAFFKQTYLMRYYILTAVLYPIFTVFIAILSFFGGYTWKNRTYKR